MGQCMQSSKQKPAPADKPPQPAESPKSQNSAGSVSPTSSNSGIDPVVADWLRTVKTAQEPSIRGLVEGMNAYYQTPAALDAAMTRLLSLCVTTAEDHEAARETF